MSVFLRDSIRTVVRSLKHGKKQLTNCINNLHALATVRENVLSSVFIYLFIKRIIVLCFSNSRKRLNYLTFANTLLMFQMLQKGIRNRLNKYVGRFSIIAELYHLVSLNNDKAHSFIQQVYLYRRY